MTLMAIDVRILGRLKAVSSTGLLALPSDESLLIANLLDLNIADILNGSYPLANCLNVGRDYSPVHRL